jgi:hypothetical protein
MGRFGADAGDLGKGLEQLGLHARGSSCRCSRDQAALAWTVQRSIGSRPGLDDSRASQAMRWWVLRAAFHCGPRCGQAGCMACGKASISVQQGATCTSAMQQRQRRGQGRRSCSRARAWTAGHCQHHGVKAGIHMDACLPGPVVRSCQRSLRQRRRAPCGSPGLQFQAALAAGQRLCPGARISASCPARPPSAASRARQAAAATRPRGSSTCTVLALQGLHSLGGTFAGLAQSAHRAR